MLLVGVALLYMYFYPAEYRMTAPKQGFGVAMSEVVQIDSLILGLNTQRQEPEFDVQAFIHLAYVNLKNEQRHTSCLCFHSGLKRQ